jgi:hypothetical protein
MIDLLILITLIFSVFGMMSLAEWIYDAHQRGMQRLRKYDQRQSQR